MLGGPGSPRSLVDPPASSHKSWRAERSNSSPTVPQWCLTHGGQGAQLCTGDGVGTVRACEALLSKGPRATTAEEKPHMTRELFFSVPKMCSCLLEVKRGHLDCR